MLLSHTGFGVDGLGIDGCDDKLRRKFEISGGIAVAGVHTKLEILLIALAGTLNRCNTLLNVGEDFIPSFAI